MDLGNRGQVVSAPKPTLIIAYHVWQGSPCGRGPIYTLQEFH